MIRAGGRQRGQESRGSEVHPECPAGGGEPVISLVTGKRWARLPSISAVLLLPLTDGQRVDNGQSCWLGAVTQCKCQPVTTVTLAPSWA